MADLILGVQKPDRGTILIGGENPAECIRRWPGAIAYVPQEIMLANGTIRSNVALGLPMDAVDEELVWEALERAHLAEFIRQTDRSLDSTVGERGLQLSGGQRQRLGIARALYTGPRLLVLDEATSALDPETEHAITHMLENFDGSVTTIVIAHRLSTVRNADTIAYFEAGRLAATGTFTEMLHESENFARQARLSGLV